MSLQDEHAELPEPGTATDGARSLSLLQKAQKERNERETHLFLDIPSWNGDLIGEYEIIDKDVLKDMAERNTKRIRQGGFDKVQADIDLILKAAVGLWVRDPESGDRVMLEDEHGQVGFDRIHIVLNKEHLIKSAAEAVRYLTGERGEDDDTWKENAVAIGMHSQTLSRWMKDPSKRSLNLEELLGES